MSRRPDDWKLEFAHITTVFPRRLEEIMGGMTFTQLALLSGVSASTLTSWRAGRTIPDLRLLFSVCTVLDASIDWIVGLDEMPNPAPQSTVDDTRSTVDDTQQVVDDTQPIEDDAI